MTETLAICALALSVFNTLLWIAFLITIRKVFYQLYPMLNMLGLMGGISTAQNLTRPPIYDKMVEPDSITDPNKSK